MNETRRICVYCGTPIYDNDNGYCPYCGGFLLDGNSPEEEYDPYDEEDDE